MRNIRVILAASALAAASSLSPAHADDCSKTVLYTSVQMERTSSDTMLVPVTLNGVNKMMLLDTGGVISQISESTASELGLHPIEGNMELYGATGQVSRKRVNLDTFSIGTLKGKSAYFNVSSFGGGKVAGLLAPDFMVHFDIDLDFGADKLNFISQDHCPGRVVYWQAPAVAIIPFKLDEGNHITVPVTIDDKPMTAIIDTGSSDSVMNMTVATRVYTLSSDSPDMVEAGTLGGDEKMKIYLHTFGNLSFEGITVKNPRLMLMPDEMNKNADKSFRAGSNIKRWSDDITLPDVIIGMNVLRKLHVYLAFKEKKLYVTAASSSPAADGPAAAAPAR